MRPYARDHVGVPIVDGLSETAGAAKWSAAPAPIDPRLAYCSDVPARTSPITHRSVTQPTLTAPEAAVPRVTPVRRPPRATK